MQITSSRLVSVAQATDPNAHVLKTDEGLKYFAPSRQAAWLGLLQAHAALTRALDQGLATRHGLTLSSYEVLARLAHSPNGYLRMTDLTEQTQLSLSRVSRVVDQLESRALVARRSCPGDSRAVHASVTEGGRELVGAAQDTFFDTVEELFLGKLSCDEIDTLGSLFGRLGPVGPESCPGPG